MIGMEYLYFVDIVCVLASLGTFNTNMASLHNS